MQNKSLDVIIKYRQGEMADNNKIMGVFSYQLNDVMKSHFMLNKIQPSYKFKFVSSLILVALNIISFLSFIPIFGITLLARVTNPHPAFDSLAKIGLVIFLVFFLLLIISVIGIYQPFTRSRIRKSYNANKSFYDEKRELIIDNDGVSINLLDWNSSLGWSRIERVYEYDDGYLIIIHQADYLVIPKRAFQNDETMHKFNKLTTEIKGNEILQIK